MRGVTSGTMEDLSGHHEVVTDVPVAISDTGGAVDKMGLSQRHIEVPDEKVDFAVAAVADLDKIGWSLAA